MESTMFKFALFCIILLSLAIPTLCKNCPINVPDDCRPKCLQYFYNVKSGCHSCDCVPLEGLWEGDIDLDEPTRALLNDALNDKTKAGSIRAKWDIFPNGNVWNVPYRILRYNGIGESGREAIKAAIEEFHKVSCIRFIPHTIEDYAILIFQHADSCFSQVGRRTDGYMNSIGLAPDCWYVQGIIIHELLHALGFWHEQSRPDRDNYVRVVPENIIPDKLHNFQKYSTDLINSYGSPYDIGSIMHYPTNAFSSNGKSTITLANGDPLVGVQREYFAATDIEQLNAMYRCNEAPFTTTTTTTKATTTSPPPTCVDKKEDCKNFAELGKCISSVDWMKENCPRICGFCPDPNECADNLDYPCSTIKLFCGLSTVVENCPKTCNKCK